MLTKRFLAFKFPFWHLLLIWTRGFSGSSHTPPWSSCFCFTEVQSIDCRLFMWWVTLHWWLSLWDLVLSLVSFSLRQEPRLWSAVTLQNKGRPTYLGTSSCCFSPSLVALLLCILSGRDLDARKRCKWGTDTIEGKWDAPSLHPTWFWFPGDFECSCHATCPPSCLHALPFCLLPPYLSSCPPLPVYSLVFPTVLDLCLLFCKPCLFSFFLLPKLLLICLL